MEITLKTAKIYAAIVGLTTLMTLPVSAQEQRKLDLNLDGTTSVADRLSDCGITGNRYDAFFWENEQWVFDGNLQINAATTKGGDTTLTGQLGGWSLNYRFASCQKPPFAQDAMNGALFGSPDNGVYMLVDTDQAVYLVYQANDGSIGEYALDPS